jgi:hypothetical protein
VSPDRTRAAAPFEARSDYSFILAGRWGFWQGGNRLRQASPQGIGSLNHAYRLHIDPEGTARIAAEHGLVTAAP